MKYLYNIMSQSVMTEYLYLLLECITPHIFALWFLYCIDA